MRGVLGTSALAAVMAVAAGSGGPASAQQTENVQLAEADITVTATRTEQDVLYAPATVTVIGEDEIEENLANDVEDLVRFEPGVSVQQPPARFNTALSSTGRTGNAGFNIRGLDGNRVLIMVDGVRVPDGFNFTPITFGRGEYVDVGVVERVEILRGPSSAMYGSDGLAGAVSFITRDPNSFIADDGTFALRARVGYASADESWSETLTGAARWDNWSAMLSYTRRDGGETETQGENDVVGSTRTTANPQDISSNAVLGRIVFEPSDAHRFRLTAEYSDRDVSSNMLTAIGASLGQTTTALLGEDTSERARLAFDHAYTNEGGLIDRAYWSVYYQASEALQYTFEDRYLGSPASPTDRFRENTFDNAVWGGGFHLESAFSTGSIEHRLVYGGDYSTNRMEGLRNGGPNPAPPAEQLPNRPFPNTDHTLIGAFIQDEISLLNGQLMLYPALRYDSYEISPEDDALYLGTPSTQEDSTVTPRFAALAWPTDHFGAYFSYAEGFKAPSPNQVNEYFTNNGPNAWYSVAPNPNLAPESSQSFEVGVRWRDINLLGGGWQGSFVAYDGEYEDFIERITLFGTGLSPLDPAAFQYVNLSSVSINGVEARTEGRWDNGFGLILSAAVSEGETGAGAALESIDPLRVVAGLSWDSAGGAFGGQAIVTYAARKSDASTTQAFRPDAYTLLDLTAYWNVTEAASLRLGIFNATDETYWHWSDVRGTGLTPTSVSRDAFTQPGRNFSVSVAYRF
jgi:hemoglobin/transferrin/lactoferrin receptor protein